MGDEKWILYNKMEIKWPWVVDIKGRITSQKIVLCEWSDSKGIILITVEQYEKYHIQNLLQPINEIKGSNKEKF